MCHAVKWFDTRTTSYRTTSRKEKANLAVVDASKTVMDVLGVVVANDERRTECKSWDAATFSCSRGEILRTLILPLSFLSGHLAGL